MRDVLPTFVSSPSHRSLVFGAAVTMALVVGKSASAKENKAPPKPQNILPPDAALERLLKGNTRYVKGMSLRHDFRHEREADPERGG